jgi:hypothetical protein
MVIHSPENLLMPITARLDDEPEAWQKLHRNLLASFFALRVCQAPVVVRDLLTLGQLTHAMPFRVETEGLSRRALFHSGSGVSGSCPMTPKRSPVMPNISIATEWTEMIEQTPERMEDTRRH